MDNRKLESFTQEARRQLIDQIKQKAYQYGITEEKIIEPEVNSDNELVINGIKLDQDKRQKRLAFIQKLDRKNYKNSYNQLIEEVAYTWFNRLTAIRYLEVNNYFDHGIRVLSTKESGKRTPDIVENALKMDLDLTRDEYYGMLDNLKDDEIFRELLILQCNKLNEILAFMFPKENDYTELLLPDNLLDADSIVSKLVKVGEENFEDIEVIGWLYQYYISELKDKNIKKKKYKKEDIPSVTQLFTPHWIVQYMVQNSLGKMWLESHPDQFEIKKDWEYYLEPAEQDEEVTSKLEKIINPNLKPEEITFLDPACGSGHILVYAFDLLYEIYQRNGYSSNVIVKSILENNLYGLDIDKRAVQLAKFAVMMKAREKDRRIFDKNIEPNVYSIEESEKLEKDTEKYLLGRLDNKEAEIYNYLVDAFSNAKEFGSLIKVKDYDYELLKKKIKKIGGQEETVFEVGYIGEIQEKIMPLIKQAKIMAKKYDVVVTNPPYAGGRSLPKKLKKYLKDEYSDSKKDLFAAFIDRCLLFTKPKGFTSMITMHSWMFLSSFEKLRKKIVSNKTIDTMIHLGTRAFPEIGGEVVQSTSFTLRDKNKYIETGEFLRLTDFNNSDLKAIKTREAIINPNVDYRYTAKTEDFKKIPGYNIGFWVSESTINNFRDGQLLESLGVAFQGIITGDNSSLVRYWHEVDLFNIIFSKSVSEGNWVPYKKGGHYRKWFGNNHFVVSWHKKGTDFTRNRSTNKNKYFLKALTWSYITSGDLNARIIEEGFLWDVSSSPYFTNDNNYIFYILSFLNSKVGNYYSNILNPTINFQNEDILKLPILYNKNKYNSVKNVVKKNINISKKDWDSFETSWDFETHPLIEHNADSKRIEEAFNYWSEFAEIQFNQLWENEEELNKIFIEIYGLEDELTSEVEEKDITVRKADFERDIKSFISYAVGNMLGRYSLDEKGLAYAGGEFDPNKYETYQPDKDGIVTILEDDLFENDVVKRLVDFVRVTFGEEYLEVNLEYIVSALTPRSSERPRETIRRYFETKSKFYKDHCQTYNKRPIYWKVSSGGRNPAFMALIYLHRYSEDTLSILRINYLHPYIRKLDQERDHLRNMIVRGVSTSEEAKYNARINDISEKLDELRKFDEKLGHLADQRISLDLDDGVVENYKKLEDILESIR